MQETSYLLINPNQVSDSHWLHMDLQVRREYRDNLQRQGYAANSVTLKLNTLSGILSKCVRLGYCRSNPVKGIEKPRKSTPNVTHYTPEEIRTIFSAFERRAESVEAWATYKETIYALYYTGMRICDVLAMRWESINLNFKVIEARQIKTGKPAYSNASTDRKMTGNILENGIFSGSDAPPKNAHKNEKAL
jgi:integrase